MEASSTFARDIKQTSGVGSLSVWRRTEFSPPGASEVKREDNN
jgi:hypothetical protein